MVTNQDAAQGPPSAGDTPRGFQKFLSDSWSIAEIKVIVTRRHLLWHAFGALILPLSMFYWATAISPERFETNFRILVGTIILGIGQAIGSNVGTWTLMDRFTRRLRLLVTMPVSKASYAMGTLGYGVLQSVVLVALVLLFARLAGAEYSIHWTVPLLVLGVIVTMTGATLIVVSLVPGVNSGINANGMLGIVLVMLSPVFYTFEDAPRLFKWLGWISPFRYAADGIEKGLNGHSASWPEITILAGSALVLMAIGVRILRWRDL